MLLDESFWFSNNYFTWNIYIYIYIYILILLFYKVQISLKLLQKFLTNFPKYLFHKYVYVHIYPCNTLCTEFWPQFEVTISSFCVSLHLARDVSSIVNHQSFGISQQNMTVDGLYFVWKLRAAGQKKNSYWD